MSSSLNWLRCKICGIWRKPHLSFSPAMMVHVFFLSVVTFELACPVTSCSFVHPWSIVMLFFDGGLCCILYRVGAWRCPSGAKRIQNESNLQGSNWSYNSNKWAVQGLLGPSKRLGPVPALEMICVSSKQKEKVTHNRVITENSEKSGAKVCLQKRQVTWGSCLRSRRPTTIMCLQKTVKTYHDVKGQVRDGRIHVQESHKTWIRTSCSVLAQSLGAESRWTWHCLCCVPSP